MEILLVFQQQIGAGRRRISKLRDKTIERIGSEKQKEHECREIKRV